MRTLPFTGPWCRPAATMLLLSLACARSPAETPKGAPPATDQTQAPLRPVASGPPSAVTPPDAAQPVEAAKRVEGRRVRKCISLGAHGEGSAYPPGPGRLKISTEGLPADVAPSVFVLLSTCEYFTAVERGLLTGLSEGVAILSGGTVFDRVGDRVFRIDPSDRDIRLTLDGATVPEIVLTYQEEPQAVSRRGVLEDKEKLAAIWQARSDKELERVGLEGFDDATVNRKAYEDMEAARRAGELPYVTRLSIRENGQIGVLFADGSGTSFMVVPRH